MNPTGDSAPPLVLRRVLPAPPAAVFAAWTDPARLGRWLAPHGGAMATVDLRSGGGFRVAMVGPGGAGGMIEHAGEYLVIEPPTRLVFTWHSPFIASGPTLVTVLLRPHDAGTELTLIHAQLPADALEPHREGWSLILARLAAHLRDPAAPSHEA